MHGSSMLLGIYTEMSVVPSGRGVKQAAEGDTYLLARLPEQSESTNDRQPRSSLALPLSLSLSLLLNPRSLTPAHPASGQFPSLVPGLTSFYAHYHQFILVCRLSNLPESEFSTMHLSKLAVITTALAVGAVLAE